MPGPPDIVVYIEALRARICGEAPGRTRVRSPSRLLRDDRPGRPGEIENANAAPPAGRAAGEARR